MGEAVTYWRVKNVLGRKVRRVNMTVRRIGGMMIEGEWPENDLRRAFVNGAKWWEYHSTGFTMWQSDRDLAEDEAERRYPDGAIRLTPHQPDAPITPDAEDGVKE